MNTQKKETAKWGFRSATFAIFGLALLSELAVHFVSQAQSRPGNERWGYAVAFFFLIGLPLLGLLVYRTRLVFDFFRSVKVGVVNLIFIGLASILGVLFLQEDPYRPMAHGGLDALVERQESQDEATPWTRLEKQAYQDFLSFRNAQSYFAYQFLHGFGFHSLPRVNPECSLNPEDIEEKMEILERNLIPLRSRFGEDYTVALEAKSGTGLRVRQENAELAEFESSWDDFWWSMYVWCDRLDFIRVYQSDWFATFWFILFFGVLSNTFRGGWRRLLKPKKFGFLTTHTGVMLMLLAAFWGRLAEVRGSLDLNVGQISGSFRGHEGGRKIHFRDVRLSGNGAPFRVQLEAFRADYHDVLEVIYAKPSGNGFVEEFEGLEVPKSRVYEGQVMDFDWAKPHENFPEALLTSRGASLAPWLQLEVEKYVPQSELFPVLRESPDSEGGHPMAQLEVLNASGRVEAEQILFHGFPSPLVHAESGARFLFHAAESMQAAKEIAQAPIQDSYGTLHLSHTHTEHKEGETTLSVMVGQGDVFEVEGNDYAVEVLQVVPTFRPQRSVSGEWVHDSSKDQPFGAPSNPAVLVEITNSKGAKEERWILQGSGYAPPAQFEELDLVFQWDSWTAPAKSRWWVFQLPDSSCYLAQASSGGGLVDFEKNSSIPIAPNFSIRLADAKLRGTLGQEIEKVEGADFFHPAPGSVVVRATTPDGQESFSLSTEGRQQMPRVEYTGPDGESRVAFLHFHTDQRDMPLEWQSKLSMLEKDSDGNWKATASGAIRVNDYFYHKGWRFFQSNANPEDPTYSGIGVVYDPGLEIVLIGLYMVMFGTIIVYVVNPLTMRKHRGV